MRRLDHHASGNRSRRPAAGSQASRTVTAGWAGMPGWWRVRGS